MVLTGSLRRRIVHSNRRRHRVSRCGKKKSENSCLKNKKCTWKVGRKRSFCRRSGNRKRRTFKRYNIFHRKRKSRRHRKH